MAEESAVEAEVEVRLELRRAVDRREESARDAGVASGRHERRHRARHLRRGRHERRQIVPAREASHSEKFTNNVRSILLVQCKILYLQYSKIKVSARVSQNTSEVSFE